MCVVYNKILYVHVYSTYNNVEQQILLEKVFVACSADTLYLKVNLICEFSPSSIYRNDVNISCDDFFNHLLCYSLKVRWLRSVNYYAECVDYNVYLIQGSVQALIV